MRHVTGVSVHGAILLTLFGVAPRLAAQSGPGYDYHRPTDRLVTRLIGIAVGQGLLELDGPLPFDGWEPREEPTAGDPRRAITLRNVLHMSSGLYPVDNRLCHVVGSCLTREVLKAFPERSWGAKADG